ncbi:hypothetical protein [Clostridium akagii]|uniref:hypothetical protein n=1 Tax=Clostridium akagii TaxID=91623 RepID=UPI00047D96D1|nr:hypothetical protein [Clostridium akagii]
MGTILLNSSQLNQYAKQVSQLLTELKSMQTDIKASVNELDSSSTGKSAKHASDVMFDCYGKGQKVSAGITEISAIVSNAVSLFTELDSRVGNNMAQIYTDPEHAKAFFSSQQANVKNEVKSDFVELGKKAKDTESDTFKREEPKSLWDNVSEFFGNPKVQAVLTVAGGLLVLAGGGGFFAAVIGVALLVHGLSDVYENFVSKDKFNPLRDVGYKYAMQMSEGKEVSDGDVKNFYGGVESTLSAISIFANPKGIVSAIKNVPEAINGIKNIASDGITLEKAGKVVGSGLSYYWKNLANDAKVTEFPKGLKAVAKANYISMAKEVKDSVGYVYGEVKGGNNVKAAIKFGYDYWEIPERSEKLGQAIRPASLLSDLSTWNPTKQFFSNYGAN